MKLRLSCLLAAVALSLMSCIGIDTDARIGADGTVDVTLVYTVSSAVDDLGKLGANADYLPLPVGRDDLALAASRVGGELRSWARKDGTDSFIVTTTLRFPGVAAFASFIDPKGSLAVYAESGGRSSLSLTLSEGKTPDDKELLDFIRTAFADYAISIRITTPRPPTATGGFVVSGREATFSMKAADLYASTTPIELGLSW